MTRDLDTLQVWLRFFLWIAAICTTLFPVLYLFSPWYSTKLGRLLMLQAVAFAFAIDFSLVFRYWRPENILVTFWVTTVAYGLIAASTFSLTLMLWFTNHRGSSMSRTERSP